MSHHIIEKDSKKYVFGWDPPLQTFFLQVHDLTREEDDEERIRFVVGADSKTRVENLQNFRYVAEQEGLVLRYDTEVQLFEEQANGR